MFFLKSAVFEDLLTIYWYTTMIAARLLLQDHQVLTKPFYDSLDSILEVHKNRSNQQPTDKPSDHPIFQQNLGFQRRSEKHQSSDSDYLQPCGGNSGLLVHGKTEGHHVQLQTDFSSKQYVFQCQAVHSQDLFDAALLKFLRLYGQACPICIVWGQEEE